MKIMITGNLGYVGPVLVEYLKREYPSYELTGFDTGFYKPYVMDGTHHVDPHIQIIGDIRTVDASLLKGLDAVIHLAAISNDPIGNHYEEATYEINHRASIRLARLCKDSGVKRFAFASSCSVYGSADDNPRTERSTLNPLTAYAKSKIMTEEALQPLADESFHITCLRFATACGMSPRLRLDLVLNDFVASAIALDAIRILSDGKPWRPLIHVKDMARAFDWAIHRSDSDPEHFRIVNAGSNEWNYQVAELAHAVAEQFPGVKVEINRSAPADKRSYRVDFSFYKQLNPKKYPRVTLPEAISTLKSGLLDSNFQDRSFREGKLMRLNILQDLRSNDRINGNLEWTHLSNEVPGNRD